MPPRVDLREVTGFQGEKVCELALTDFSTTPRPLFRPAFLGDKWPVIDFYVQLEGVGSITPFFFASCRSTSRPLSADARSLRITCSPAELAALARLPAPTYVIGVHVPTRKAFIRAVPRGRAARGIGSIAVQNKLVPANLRRLYDEVRGYWSGSDVNPHPSVLL